MKDAYILQKLFTKQKIIYLNIYTQYLLPMVLSWFLV